MEINALKTFLEVAQTRHFGRAAETLFVTQSTVSTRIKTLEEELGVELFVRERGNIRLTAAGESLITHAKSMMTLWARAKQEIASPDGTQHKLVFGGLSGLWDITLQSWLSRVATNYPELAITADIYSTETMYARILEGSMDLAFLYDAPQGVNLVSQQLTPIKLRLVSSKPVQRLEADWGESFIQVDWGHNFAVQFASEFPDISGSKITTGLGRIAQLQLLSNGGYAYLAEPAVGIAVESKQLYYVPDAPVFSRHAYALYHQESSQRDIIESLLELF